jgi:peroxiredoxin
MMKRGFLLALVAVFIALGAQTGCTQQKEKSAAATGTLKKAPAFTLTSTDGKAVSLADYKGKVVIVDFWDTWCPPCRMEIPHFIELTTQYRGKGFEMLGVALGREGKDTVVNFIKKNGINYVNVMATNDFIDAYGPIDGIPTTFVIDQKGQIYKTYTGYRDKAVFEADIKALLK